MNKSIFDIHVIDVYFTSVHSNPRVFYIHVIDVHLTSINSSPWVFDTGSIAKISNSKHDLQNKQRLVKGEVTMCVGNDSKVYTMTLTHSLYLRD